MTTFNEIVSDYNLGKTELSLNTAQEIIASGYYNFSGSPDENIVSASDYRNDIEGAIEEILNPTSIWSVSFSDVANIDFQETNDNAPKTMRKVAA